ncbi:MAG: iron-containing alcohol dehydrogenase [Oscillospiraceae bacterium]|jgi:alcohol dehydrogenase YqhD (iron-dependent ADH family)|nr:iron-containing alcohol dehydrogenase [Oscillospiraceae bacterium]
MLEFSFHWPPRMLFGPGSRKKIGSELKDTCHKALLVCAKGPFRENGLYEDVRVSLESAGIAVCSMGDVDQNPRLSSVREGAAVCKRDGVDVVVAIGGGSAMDCAKLIAVAALYDCDPYDFVWGARLPITRSLKTVLIPTIAATGTETNPSAVIVNDETREKYYCDCQHAWMVIFDPTVTQSAPPHLVIWGAMDILSHTFEYYFNGYEGSEFQSRFSEAIILSVMHALNTLRDTPGDLTALGELQWCATMAWGGLTKLGRMEPEMTCHWIEESFSGYFDTHHGACLGVMTPRWMRLVCQDRPSLFARFARNVMGILEQNDTLAAQQGVEAYIQWLKSIHAPNTFYDIGKRDFSDAEIEHVVSTAWRIYNGQIGKLRHMTYDDCVALLKSGREPI